MVAKILLVEDNEAIRKAIAEEMSISGFDVVEAADGEEALAKLIPTKPDLVILDLILPKVNGLDVLKRIRDNPDTKDWKVAILTNLEADNLMIENMLRLKPSFYLMKQNINISELPGKVKECLSA